MDLWVEVVVDFMGFVHGGRVGFFHGGGDGWLKERDGVEKIIIVIGEMREREIILYYFIR